MYSKYTWKTDSALPDPLSFLVVNTIGLNQRDSENTLPHTSSLTCPLLSMPSQGYVFTCICCLSVCLFVSNITQKVVNGF